MQPPDRLEGTYIELLGWPPGAPARKEIADSPFGLEALVFPHDAEATYERLRAAGFAVNPVQELSRPALLDGREVTARFHTVRFAEQPLPGIRMYFCRHLTPECVWSPALMSHPMARAACAHRCPRGRRPCRRATPGAGRRRDRASWQDGGWDVPLANLRIHVSEDPQAAQPTLSALTLENRDGAHYALDTGL